ncbi:MAG TPA: Ig-like domain-containing protein [Anaerolineales bacterium]|nr:Ig-like domain-containing protein [Anaerolineales bacterium]
MKKAYTAVLVVIMLLTSTGSVAAQEPVGADCTDPPNLVPGADLTNCDLSGEEMEGVDLSNANLTGANLDNASLFTSIVEGATFDNASLRNTLMEAAEADGASFVNADMRGVDLYFADVRDANLTGANFTDTWMHSIDFERSNMQNAVFTGSTLTSVDLQETDLRGADLSFTLLRNSPMRNADLRNATLLGAELDGSNVLDGITWGNTTCSDGSNSHDDDGDNFTCESNFIINQPPTITLTSPAEDITVTLDDIVTVSADAADSDGSVMWVEFYANGGRINMDGTAPYSFDWSPPVHGTYEITARATDNDNDMTTSQSVTVNVVASPNNQPPAVSITSPKDGAKVSLRWGTTIRADVDDPDGDFVRVEFYAGSTLLGYDLFAPYSFNWKPDSSGFHTLTARAIDETGLEATSDPVTVRVR